MKWTPDGEKESEVRARETKPTHFYSTDVCRPRRNANLSFTLCGEKKLFPSSGARFEKCGVCAVIALASWRQGFLSTTSCS